MCVCVCVFVCVNTVRVCCIGFADDTQNIWYVSDGGSDQNDCHTESTPCRNLQTVLGRAADGAAIYVTSTTLSLDGPRRALTRMPSETMRQESSEKERIRVALPEKLQDFPWYHLLNNSILTFVFSQ